MSGIVKKYCRLIEQQEDQCKESPTYKSQRQEFMRKRFMTEIIGKISQKNDKIKITKDNDFAVAIIQLTGEVKKDFRRNFKRSEQKIGYLVAINQAAYNEKFISKREYERVICNCQQIKNMPQFRLNVELDTLIKQSNRQDFRETLLNQIQKQQIDTDDDEKVGEAYQRFYELALRNYDRSLVIKIDEIISNFQNKEEMLTPELLAEIEKYVGTDIGKNDDQIQINRLLSMKAEEESLASNQIHKEKMEQQFQYLKSIMNKFCSMKLLQNDLKLKLHLAVFGSNVSGFASKNTDMDLTILTDCYVHEKNFLQYLQKFLQAEFKEKDRNSYKLEYVDARIPLLKLKFINKEMQFHFDIIVNNILGVINSKFLAVYGQIQWIKYLVLLVKQWGKAQQLVNESMFSSYGLTLMVLNFLIMTNKIKLIMDSRTRGEDAAYFVYKRSVRDTIEEFKVYYEFKTHPKDVTSLKRVNLYQLLIEFFQYYYVDEDPESDRNGGHWKLTEQQRIISVDGGFCDYDSNFIFTIKDPFDSKHNPGRVKELQKNKVMLKFKKAIDTMKGKMQREIENLFVKN